MMEPLISVIIPVYKVEAYLDACIQSVVEQTYSNLEIILVDDGSPDHCPQMCDAWIQKDARIRVIHQKNGGSSAARNAGLDIATGEYIGFVDSDDILAPDMYEIMFRALEGENIGIACCSSQLMADDGTLLNKTQIPAVRRMNAEQALDAIFTLQMGIAVWSKLYRREVFEGIRFPVGETNEDAPVTIPTIVRANGVIHVQKWPYYYRQHMGSITANVIPNEGNSHIVHKNLQIMRNQLKEYSVKETANFRFYEAAYSFWRAQNYEKNYAQLTEKIKDDYKIYRGIMWKNALIFLASGYSSIKDKALYVLVLTKLLRPAYKLFRTNG